jgi:hypothetical protein
MATELTTSLNTPSESRQVLDEQLRCALTGKALRADEAYWAPPLITTRTLVATIVRTALNAPSDLGRVLMEEQTNVPYDPQVRDVLAKRRSAEQLKLLLLLMSLIALIVVPILLITIS